MTRPCPQVEAPLTPCVNRDVLLELFGEHLEELPPLIQRFIDQSDKSQALIESAAAARDMAVLEAAVHDAVGLVGVFGTGRTFSSAQALQRATRSDDFDAFNAELQRFGPLLRGLHSELRALARELSVAAPPRSGGGPAGGVGAAPAEVQG